MIKKHIRPDSFIHQAMKSVNLSGEEEELRQKFLEKYQDQYSMFLFEEALERLALTHPVLRTKIEDTSLSNRAKNALRTVNIITVGDLAQFTPEELRSIRNMGAGTVKEIEDYIVSQIG